MVVGQLRGDLGKQTNNKNKSIKSLRNSFACSDQKAGIPLAVCVRITACINQLLCLTANQHINSSFPYEHFWLCAALLGWRRDCKDEQFFK